MTFTFTPQQELAQTQPVQLDKARFPQYGRYLEEYVPGQIFIASARLRFHASTNRFFLAPIYNATPSPGSGICKIAWFYGDACIAATSIQRCVVSWCAKRFRKVMADLGYYNAQFLRPVYAGDTIRAMTASYRSQGTLGAG